MKAKHSIEEVAQGIQSHGVSGDLAYWLAQLDRRVYENRMRLNGMLLGLTVGCLLVVSLLTFGCFDSTAATEFTDNLKGTGTVKVTKFCKQRITQEADLFIGCMDHLTHLRARLVMASMDGEPCPAAELVAQETEAIYRRSK